LRFLSFVLIILLSSLSWGSSTRTVSADSLVSSSGAKTFSLPAATDTLAGIAATQTVTNKTISGASNTLSNLPIQAQMVQDVFYGNGALTSFTLSFTIGTASGLICRLDGAALTQGAAFDYTVSGTTLTMTSAPGTGQMVLCSYSNK
jgi:hypothetical protein